MVIFDILLSRTKRISLYVDDFLQESIMRGEKGMDTAWMRFMWPIKSCLWLGIVFLIIQGISELFKSYWAATKGKWPGGEN